MTSKRYLGNIITDTPTAPTNNYETTSASGVWSLAEANAYTAAGLWPTAGNAAPVALFGGFGWGVSQVDYISFGGSLGNATDFGDYNVDAKYLGGCSSSTRSLSCGGWVGSAFNYTNHISYTTFAATGTFSDFGDMTSSRVGPTGLSSSTRGVFCMGAIDSGGFTSTNVLDYVTIASTGNASDFGDATFAGYFAGSLSSPTRGVIGGGAGTNDADRRNVIQYITIASTGNATDFGDLLAGKSNTGGASNDTRGLFMGGNDGGSNNVIEYITIASTGNSTDFGDTVALATSSQAVASSTRALTPYYSGSTFDQLCYVTIATTGNASDFGDLATTTNDGAGFANSNSHGGLQ